MRAAPAKPDPAEVEFTSAPDDESPHDHHPSAAKRQDEDEEDEEEESLFRRGEQIADDMDLTPMVDVTFQLLIFFMVTASFTLQKSIHTPTPDPNQKGATQSLQSLDDLQGTSILVKIDAKNQITIDDDPLSDPEQLSEMLKEKMRKEQKSELIITANRSALHRYVVSVVDAANHVGMQKIRMTSSVEQNE